MASLVWATILAGLIAAVAGDGDILVRFKYFENPQGLDFHGECCDHTFGKLRCVRGGCDHMFTICIDQRAESTCSIGRVQSASIKDRDEIIFGERIGNLTNPFRFHVSGPLPRSIDMKVVIYDDDSDKGSSNDYVDQVKTRVNSIERSPKLYEAKHRTTLEAEIWAECSPGWVGPQCQTRGSANRS